MSDKIFEENPEIEKMIKKVIKKHSEENYQAIYVRDMIIEKFQQNVKMNDIYDFCEAKKIKLIKGGKN